MISRCILYRVHNQISVRYQVLCYSIFVLLFNLIKSNLMNNKTCTEIENGPDQDCHPLKDSIQLNSHHSKITPKKPSQSSVKKHKVHVFIRNPTPSVYSFYIRVFKVTLSCDFHKIKWPSVTNHIHILVEAFILTLVNKTTHSNYGQNSISCT